MPKITLTAAFVESANSNGKRVEFCDSKVQGLVLRVTEAGSKSWSLRYRRGQDGKQSRVTLGRYPALSLKDARERTFELNSQIAKGQDPATEKKNRRSTALRDGTITISLVSVDYFADAARGRHRSNASPKRKSTLDLERSYFDRLVAPELGGCPLRSLDRRRARNFIREIEDKHGGSAARQCMAILRQIFSYAVFQELIEANPLQGIYAAKASARMRTFTEEELRSIWSAVEAREAVSGLALSRSMALAIQLSILTLQRAKEILHITMEELDLNANTWTIPGNRTKNGHLHVVPLSDTTIKVIKEAAALNEAAAQKRGLLWDRKKGPLFPYRKLDGTMDRHSMTRAMSRLLAVLKISNGTLHDLRRTGATFLTGERFQTPRFIVSQILNHKSDTDGPAVTRVYDRNEYLAEKRQKLQEWSDFLIQIKPFSNCV